MPQPIANYMGFNLFATKAITKQVQRRTHRKKRTNKKWAKRYGYKTVLDDEKIIRVGNCLYATPNTAEKIKLLSEEMKQYKSPGKTMVCQKFEFKSCDTCAFYNEDRDNQPCCYCAENSCWVKGEEDDT